MFFNFFNSDVTQLQQIERDFVSQGEYEARMGFPPKTTVLCDWEGCEFSGCHLSELHCCLMHSPALFNFNLKYQKETLNKDYVTPMAGMTVALQIDELENGILFFDVKRAISTATDETYLFLEDDFNRLIKLNLREKYKDSMIVIWTIPTINEYNKAFGIKLNRSKKKKNAKQTRMNRNAKQMTSSFAPSEIINTNGKIEFKFSKNDIKNINRTLTQQAKNGTKSNRSKSKSKANPKPSKTKSKQSQSLTESSSDNDDADDSDYKPSK